MHDSIRYFVLLALEFTVLAVEVKRGLHVSRKYMQFRVRDHYLCNVSIYAYQNVPIIHDDVIILLSEFLTHTKVQFNLIGCGL